VNQPLFMPYRV